MVASLRDGRWGTQQANMAAYSAREFGGRARIQYLLEGGKEPAPPWACSCARCACRTGDERATGGCLREGYPTVRVMPSEVYRQEADRLLNLPTQHKAPPRTDFSKKPETLTSLGPVFSGPRGHDPAEEPPAEFDFKRAPGMPF